MLKARTEEKTLYPNNLSWCWKITKFKEIGTIPGTQGTLTQKIRCISKPWRSTCSVDSTWLPKAAKRWSPTTLKTQSLTSWWLLCTRKQPHATMTRMSYINQFNTSSFMLITLRLLLKSGSKSLICRTTWSCTNKLLTVTVVPWKWIKQTCKLVSRGLSAYRCACRSKRQLIFTRR